jgi:hypothetical protein
VPLVPSCFSTRCGYRAFSANRRASAQLAVVLTPSHRQSSVHIRQKEASCSYSFLFCPHFACRGGGWCCSSSVGDIIEHLNAEMFLSLVDDARWVVHIRGGYEILTRSQAYCRCLFFDLDISSRRFPSGVTRFRLLFLQRLEPLPELWTLNTLILCASSIRLEVQSIMMYTTCLSFLLKPCPLDS